MRSFIIALALTLSACTSEAAKPQPHSAPAGWQTVVYEDIAFAIPADWTVEKAGPQDSGCDASLSKKAILGAPGNYRGCPPVDRPNPGLSLRVTGAISPATTMFPDRHTSTTINNLDVDIYTNSNNYSEILLLDASIRFSFNGTDAATKDQIIKTINGKN